MEQKINKFVPFTVILLTAIKPIGSEQAVEIL